MKIVLITDPAQQTHGLRGVHPIPRNTAYVFPIQQPQGFVTGVGMTEPIRVYFLRRDGTEIVRFPLYPKQFTRLHRETDIMVETSLKARYLNAGDFYKIAQEVHA